MKTDIIRLENFDDIDSIRDRLEWSKADRLALVWPKRGGLFLNELEMTLLVRKAAKLGKQIAIVNGGHAFDEIAIAAGIPVFHSQASATLAQWPRFTEQAVPESRAARLEEMRADIEGQREFHFSKPAVRRIAFLSGVTAVFALLLFFLPGAVIQIFPTERTQAISFTIQAKTDIQEADLAGYVPLRSMSSLQSAAERVETSGQMPVSDRFSRGHVRLTNMSDRPVVIPEDSTVVTLTDPPIRFKTLNDVEIPGSGEEQVVEIQAMRPGSEANVPEEMIQSLEGPLGMDVTVNNDEPTTGGGESMLRSPSEDDINTLRDKVKSHLLARGEEEILAAIKSGQLAVEDSLKIEKILDEDIQPPAGQPADSLEVSLTAEIQMDYVLEEDIKASVRAAMNAGLPIGFEAVDEEIEIMKSSPPRYDREAGLWKVDVSASRRLRSTYSSPDIIRMVTGKPVNQAVDRLSRELIQRQEPQIEMKPSWWPWLPSLPFRISVEAG